MKAYKILGLLILGLTYQLADAQVNVIPTAIPFSEQFMLEDVFRINLVNTSGAALDGKLLAVITAADQQIVAEVYSSLIHLDAGALLSGRQINWIRTPRYGRSISSRHLQETGQLNAGSYAICYQFLSVQGSVLSDNCFEKEIRPLIALELLSPFDKEEITTPKPSLTWQPLIAFSNLKSTSYGIKLVAIYDGQSPERALAMNQALILESGLNATFLLYPSTALPLVEGKSYAWQVAAFRGGLEVGKTQIWQFTYLPPKDPKIVPPIFSYSYATSNPSGQYFLTRDGFIHLAYDNRYGLPTLMYDVSELQGVSDPKLKLPIVNLKPGLNFIDLKIKDFISENGDLTLTLRIKDPSSDLFYLQVKSQQ